MNQSDGLARGAWTERVIYSAQAQVRRSIFSPGTPAMIPVACTRGVIGELEAILVDGHGDVRAVRRYLPRSGKDRSKHGDESVAK